MKLVVFSDIHGNALALESFVKELSNFSYDKIVFLGDIFGYYYEQEKCFDLLKKIPNLIWLKGNHDGYAVKAYHDEVDSDKLIASYGHSYEGIRNRFTKNDIDFISDLPSSYVFEKEGKKIALFHGRPEDSLEGRIYPDTPLTDGEFGKYDTVFLGHTHCKMNRIIGKTKVISPGSLGQPRDGKGYGFLVYDMLSEECQFININVDNSILKSEIDRKDNGFQKMYDVLSRECIETKKE